MRDVTLEKQATDDNVTVQVMEWVTSLFLHDCPLGDTVSDVTVQVANYVLFFVKAK